MDDTRQIYTGHSGQPGPTTAFPPNIKTSWRLRSSMVTVIHIYGGHWGLYFFWNVQKVHCYLFFPPKQKCYLFTKRLQSLIHTCYIIFIDVSVRHSNEDKISYQRLLLIHVFWLTKYTIPPQKPHNFFPNFKLMLNSLIHPSIHANFKYPLGSIFSIT